MSKSEPDTGAIDYWKLFQGLPESYMLLRADDPDFTVIEMNRVRERLTNVKRKDAIGKPFLQVYPDTSPVYRRTGESATIEHFRQVVRGRRPKKLQAFRYDVSDARGTFQPRYWRSMYIPLALGSTKAVTHILVHTLDVTEEEQAEKRIANAEDRLEAALTIGKVGSWLWDVQEDTVVGDRNLARLFGMDARLVAKGVEIDRFMQSIYPDDRVRIQRAIRRTLKERVAFEEEYRTVTVSGAVRWVLARGKVEDQGGRLLFPGVIVDVTERRDLQAQVELAHRQDQLNRREAKILQQRNQELETIARTKDEFVALASHQLRTPATAVKQYLGMVLQGYVGSISDIQAEMLQRAFESNERQIQIINQILNAARVDTGRLVMTTMPVDICALARGIADDMHSLMEQHQHRFTVTLPPEPVRVVADIGYLRMAIENVLHNAAIYTPEGGRISLVLQVTGTSVRLQVTDTGVGIKKSDLGKLFTKFSRIHNPLSVQAGGSGIGLYLTAEIIRLHGGSVTVASQLHQGTTFAILLPLEHNSTKAERSSNARALTEVKPKHPLSRQR